MARKRICIISFSHVYRDGRVLRQMEFLAPHYDLTVIGFGEHPGYGVEWLPIDRPLTMTDKVRASLPLIPGRVFPQFYDYAYWSQPPHRQAREYLKTRSWAAIYANEWKALPLAVEAAERNHAPVVFDAHEYSPLEREENIPWRLFFAPSVSSILRRYTPQVSASITICQPIAERYAREYGFHPIVVLNAPRPVSVPDHTVDPDHIHVMHQGNTIRQRRLEVLIEAIALSDARFDLTFMLIDHERGYLDELKQAAQRIAPERVHFIDPVKPSEIVETIGRFDVGLVPYRTANYNMRVSLSNKFFEAVNGGLALVVGQSLAAIDLVERYHFGVIASDYTPRSIADALNSMSTADIVAMRAASRQASQTFNADAQLGQVVTLFQGLLGDSPA